MYPGQRLGLSKFKGGVFGFASVIVSIAFFDFSIENRKIGKSDPQKLAVKEYIAPPESCLPKLFC